MSQEASRDLRMYKTNDMLDNITMDNFKDYRAEAMRDKRYIRNNEWETLRGSFSSCGSRQRFGNK